MRRLLLFIVIATFSIAARSADLFDGYIVMTNNDTVKCKVSVGDFYGVTVINEQGEKEVYRSKDRKVVAFGYIKGFRRYEYLFLEAGAKHENGFYQRLTYGPKYKLYGRPTEVRGGSPTYLLFKQSGEFLKFEACDVFCPWKKKLREFLSDDPKADEAIEKAKPYTISFFVMGLNKE